MDAIKIKHNTAGDSRVATELPTIEDFHDANVDHISDVKALITRFCTLLKESSLEHDWTKVTEPYKSLFYRELCIAIDGYSPFVEGEWYNRHCRLERHHLDVRCPEDVNLFDVIEMVCDCVVAGMARTGDAYNVEITPEILTQAVANTVKLLKNNIEVVEGE